MMINLILYSSEAVIRIINRSKEFFVVEKIRVCNDTLWFKDMYIEFGENMITINVFSFNTFSTKKLNEYMHYVLKGEEVFISDSKFNKKYFECITPSTDIQSMYLSRI